VLAVSGEIDISNARAMRALLLKVLAETHQLKLDLGAVASMDSSGIATIIEARAKALEEGKSLLVTDASDRVRMALRLLCIDKMLMGG
jgi:anti-anti-sigma factor